jgi:hypothetical protein
MFLNDDKISVHDFLALLSDDPRRVMLHLNTIPSRSCNEDEQLPTPRAMSANSPGFSLWNLESWNPKSNSQKKVLISNKTLMIPRTSLAVSGSSSTNRYKVSAKWLAMDASVMGL